MKGLKMAKIGIIGYGYVGQAFKRMVEHHYEVIALDREKLYQFHTDGFSKVDELKDLDDTEVKETINKCDLAVICVPTPMSDKDHIKVEGINVYRCDTSIVESVVSWLKTPVILLKSTVEPGTTERLKKKYHKRIVMSPEYAGETKYDVSSRMDFQKEMVKCPFIICGGERKDCEYIFDLLIPIVGPEKKFFQVEAQDAEIIKYMENFFFGWKIIFTNLFYDAVKKTGASWYDVRDGWGMDPRVDTMHTGIFPAKRGFDGKCLPKDLNAFTYWMLKQGLDASPFVEMLKYNLKLLGKKDYLD